MILNFISHLSEMDLGEIKQFCESCMNHPEASLRFIKNDRCPQYGSHALVLCLKTASDEEVTEALEQELNSEDGEDGEDDNEDF